MFQIFFIIEQFDQFEIIVSICKLELLFEKEKKKTFHI